MSLHLATFSIVGRCQRSGMLGVAVATAVPAVGSLCPYIRAGVGAVSTQSWVNPYLAIETLDLIEQGAAAPDALAQALEADEGHALRQIGVVDAAGRAAAWSGGDCTQWYGDIADHDMSVQGNMLVGEATLTAMVESFRATKDSDLPERLLKALEAGDDAGGDKRGKQSAALAVHHQEAYAWLDLRVDDHAEPVTELRRIHGIAVHQLQPFLQGMPKRGQPAGGLPDSVSEMLLRPPPDRPGGGGSAP